VQIPGADAAELVGYVVMHREKGGTGPRVVLDMSGLRALEIDPETPVPTSDAQRLTGELVARAREEFQLLAAAERVETVNQSAGRAQARLTRLVAKHFILSAQTYRGETSFARQLNILDEITKERAELRLPRMPVDQLRLVSGVPFSIPLPATGTEMHFDAPRPLLKAAVDLAAREADALHRRRAEVTTDHAGPRSPQCGTGEGLLWHSCATSPSLASGVV
jgi:hypothetical protein